MMTPDLMYQTGDWAAPSSPAFSSTSPSGDMGLPIRVRVRSGRSGDMGLPIRVRIRVRARSGDMGLPIRVRVRVRVRSGDMGLPRDAE